MGKTRKLTAFAVVSAMIMAMLAVPVSAGTTYTPVAGTSTTFEKYLIMDAGDTVPNAEFAFTVAPGTAQQAQAATPAAAATEWYYDGNTYTSLQDAKDAADLDQGAAAGEGDYSDITDNSTEAAAGTMAVYAGIGTPTIANVTFSPSDTTSTSTSGKIDVQRDEEDRTGTAGTDTVQLDSGEKFAEHTATVSFSGITFDEPGIYRYIITETASASNAAAGIIHDSDNDRVLDVYVTDDGTGTLVVSGYVMHTDDSTVAASSATAGSDDVAAAGDALDDKTDGFTNEYTTKDLKIEKEVSGNQASRDKYFALTATLTGVNDNDVFTVSIADDNDANTNDGDCDATSGTTTATKAAYQSQSNYGATSGTVTGAELKAGHVFYLQHGQSVVIRGLPLNAQYAVTEDAEDYKSAVKSGDTNSGTIATVAGSEKMATAGFTNTRGGLIPTGILFPIIGGVALVGAAGAGLAINKRRDEEEE